MQLPHPQSKGSLSLEEALARRRSIREYSQRPLRVSQVAQLLWAAYGITNEEGYRTAPSAKARYPLEIYLVAQSVTRVSPGIYRYDPLEHSLESHLEGSFLDSLYECTFDQKAVREGAAAFLFCGVYDRVRSDFGEGAVSVTHMDLGHAAQNLHLQAVSLNLGTVVIAAFRPDEVKQLCRLPEEETPLYLMPAGHLANGD